MTDHEFTKIVNETKPVVLSAIKKHLAAEYYHVLDDVVQETYIRAYKSLSRNAFRGDSAITTWLYTIARNECYRINARMTKESNRTRHGVAEEIPYHDPSEARLGLRLEMDMINRILKKLPDKYRQVLEMYAEGRSEIEISNNLNIKKGTVKSRISRGKAIIRKAVRQLEAG